jgi:hypothetical protein
MIYHIAVVGRLRRNLLLVITQTTAKKGDFV